MITRTIDNKRYTLDQLHYDFIGGSANLYTQFKIEILDGENVLETYFYGYSISAENTIAFGQAIDSVFGQTMIDKLIELNA